MELKNFAIVHLRTDAGCNPLKGEYSISLVSMLMPLQIGGGTGDDVPLIEDCIAEAIHSKGYKLPAEGLTEIRLKESGELEGYDWYKYYEVEDWQVIVDDSNGAPA